MAKDNNLTDFLTDVADAIREKKGTTDLINPQDFSNEIKGIKTSTSMWTGHVDVEGLKAIGWDDDDIAYYQKYGVNWMEEDDEYHKVSDDNKALYGVLTADNIQKYKDRIVWLPKLGDLFTKNLFSKFKDCIFMKGIPKLNFANVSNTNSMFYNCYSLTCVPKLDISNANNVSSMFRYCYSLQHLPDMNTLNPKYSMAYMFTSCYSLREIPSLNVKNTSEALALMSQCYGLRKVQEIDVLGRGDIDDILTYCNSLIEAKIKNISSNISFAQSAAFSRDSLLYIINNESASASIVIKLHSNAYARLSTDPDIVAALANHPNVSLASA